MSEIIQEIIKGRKTFFFMPDLSIFPENYLEDFLALGYEAYFITNKKTATLQNTVDTIVNIFKDCILFFNIDFPIEGMDWHTFIRDLQKRVNPSVVIGILYTGGQTEAEKTKMKLVYLYDIGIKGGCVQLSFQHRKNFEIIEKILQANDATGRRKHVRAICTSSCFVSFLFDGEQFSGKLLDISLSHFSCKFSTGSKKIAPFTKIPNIQLTLLGHRIQPDVILCTCRKTETSDVFVFMFTTKDAKQGLDIFEQQRLTPLLYEIMSDNCMKIIEDNLYKR